MKKEALELVKAIFHLLKWDIPHNNLEDIFTAAKTQANFVAKYYIEKNPDAKEKYEMLMSEIEKLTFKQVYS